MIATRFEDDALVIALRLLCAGTTLADTARTVGKGRSNLRRALRRVLAEDIYHDGPAVIPHYPKSIVESVMQ